MPSMSRLPTAPATRRLVSAPFRSVGLVGPPMLPTSALIAESVTRIAFLLMGWHLNGSAYETKRRGASTNYGDLSAAAKLLTMGQGVTRALQLEARSRHGSIPQSNMVGTGCLGVNMPNGLRHSPC